VGGALRAVRLTPLSMPGALVRALRAGVPIAAPKSKTT